MGFIFGGNTNLTPEQVAARRRIAEALAASSLEPANSLGGGIAQLGKALAARISEGRLNKQETAGRASADAAFSSLFSDGGDQSASTPADTSSDPMAKYRGIIGQIESKGSGDYSALGPDTGKGDRAYGRYQVMGSNIPAWSREATGREMQPNEFLNDPTSQDAVFNKIFGGYMQGNGPDDAASMWFSGKPLDEAGNATDALGTSAGDYVAKFHALDAGGAGAGSMATGGAGPQISVNQTMGALNNPWLSEGQKSVLGALLKQRLDAQQGFNGTLSPGEVAYQGGREVASVPKTDAVAPIPAGFQQAQGGDLTFSKGGPHDPEVIAAEAKARNSAQDTGGDAGTIAQAIINGDQPPILTGLYRLGGPVRAKLEEQGYDFTKAKQDWDATTKLLGTMNGATQTRLRQAVGFVNESLGIVDELAQKWQAGNYPLFNKITLKAALEGVAGQEAQSLARQLSQQVQDMQSELAVVYKGGNSPTDMGLKNAAEMININDPMQTILDSTNLIRRNMKYRTASLKLATAGIGESQYNQMAPTESPEEMTTPPAPAGDATDQLPTGVTEDDVTHTLQLHPEMTREQLLEKLRAP